MEPGFTGKIGIIGGKGRMGRLMVGILERAGHRVEVFDLKDGPIDWAAAGGCRVLFLTVPLPAMEQTCRAFGPHTRPDGVVIDIGSVKEEPLKIMTKYCRGRVIGGHPLFGPGTDPLTGHTFFLCPDRPGPELEWLKGLLTDQGLKVVEIDPKEHDRLMGVIQILRHLIIFSFGSTLERAGFRSDQWENMCGPWFGALNRMLERQLCLGPELFADLAVHNPRTSEIAEAFFESVENLTRAYASRDRDRIIDNISKILPLAGDEAALPGFSFSPGADFNLIKGCQTAETGS